MTNNFEKINKPKPKEFQTQSKFPYKTVAVIGAIISFIAGLEEPSPRRYLFEQIQQIKNNILQVQAEETSISNSNQN